MTLTEGLPSCKLGPDAARLTWRSHCAVCGRVAELGHQTASRLKREQVHGYLR